MKKLIFILLLLGAAVGYAIIAMARQKELLKKTSLKVALKNINTLTWRRVSIILLFEIENKSDLNVTVRNLKLDIYINKKFITRIKKNMVKIQAKSVTRPPVEAIIEFDPSQLLAQGIATLITGIKNIEISIVGKYNLITNNIIVSRISVNETTTLGKLLTKKTTGTRA